MSLTKESKAQCMVGASRLDVGTYSRNQAQYFGNIQFDPQWKKFQPIDHLIGTNFVVELTLPRRHD